MHSMCRDDWQYRLKTCGVESLQEQVCKQNQELELLEKIRLDLQNQLQESTHKISQLETLCQSQADKAASYDEINALYEDIKIKNEQMVAFMSDDRHNKTSAFRQIKLTIGLSVILFLLCAIMYSFTVIKKSCCSADIFRITS